MAENEEDVESSNLETLYLRFSSGIPSRMFSSVPAKIYKEFPQKFLNIYFFKDSSIPS